MDARLTHNEYEDDEEHQKNESKKTAQQIVEIGTADKWLFGGYLGEVALLKIFIYTVFKRSCQKRACYIF